MDGGRPPCGGQGAGEGRREPRGGGRHLISSPGAPRAGLRAVLFDLDGTLTVPRSSWQFVHQELGFWSGRADRHQERFRSGEISYEEFCRLDALEWRGLPESRLREICSRVPFQEGAAALVGRLLAAGLRLGIVSTGLSMLADRVRSELSLHYAMANELEIADGRVTGGIRIAVGHGEKDRALVSFCRRFDLQPSSVATVGDTEGDVSMFRLSGFPVAFNAADELVRQAARVVVEEPDLRFLAPHLLAGA